MNSRNRRFIGAGKAPFGYSVPFGAGAAWVCRDCAARLMLSQDREAEELSGPPEDDEPVRCLNCDAPAPTSGPHLATASKFLPASDAWVHRLAILRDKDEDPALKRLRALAAQTPSAATMRQFQRDAEDIADADLRRGLSRFVQRMRDGRFDDEIRRRYGEGPSQARDLFRRFREAYDQQSGRAEGEVAEVTPSREVREAARRLLSALASDRAMSKSAADHVDRQLGELLDMFRQNMNGSWFRR